MLLDAASPAPPQITILGAGAPVAAIVVVSVAALLLYGLYVVHPAIARWAKHQPDPSPAPPPPVSPAQHDAGVREIVRAELAELEKRIHKDLRAVLADELRPLQDTAMSIHNGVANLERGEEREATTLSSIERTLALLDRGISNLERTKP